MHVFTLQNVPPNDVLHERDSLLIQPLEDPSKAAERGGGLIDAGDDRINDATWQNGRLYLAADDSCTYAGDPYLETCARLMEIDTSSDIDRLIGENDIGFPNGDAYYAAIRPDPAGDLLAVFGYSDPHDYPSVAAIAAIGAIVGEQGGNFTPAVELADGTSPTVERWGDYFGAAIDPTSPTTIWTAGQVADDLGTGSPYDWATHIDAVSLSATLAGALPHEVDPGYLYRGRTSQHQRISIRPAGGGGHVHNATVTLRFSCRARRHDEVSFTSNHERRMHIDANGRFHIRLNFGADRYTFKYWLTLSGTFVGGGRLSGSASGAEHSRRLGWCHVHGVRYAIHD